MNKTIALFGFLLVLLFAAAENLCAQSFLNNEYYRKAQSLKAQSEQALAAGDYDLAASLAEQATENLAKSDEYVERMTLYYTAGGWLGRAENRLTYAKSIRADVNYKVEYDAAADAAKAARTSFDAGSYNDSIQLSKDALAALENIGVVAVEEKPALPAEYAVRLILPRRDCLWVIAGYPFIYNNPWKWRTLYEANKATMPVPGNPNLIVPGQVLIIPSIKGEDRKGTYDPSAEYESLP
jgi:nucleoid-associated protein YgaU